MNKNDLITTRDAVFDDYNFIMATWLRGLYYGESWFSLTKKNTFMTNYHKILEFILKKDTTRVKIACLKDDASIILGYAVLTQDNSTLHWVFCKKSWRNIGIAKSLVPAEVKKVTHLTKLGVAILNKHGNVEFDPFSV